MKKAETEEDRLTRIEQQVQDLSKKVSTIAEAVSDLCSKDVDSRQLMSEIPAENINPWTLQAASELRASIANKVAPLQLTLREPNPQYNNARYLEPYLPTLDALKQAKNGCTAEEVSKITTRKRNTESGYLYRLYLAGYVNRVKKGKKIRYVLDEKKQSTR